MLSAGTITISGLPRPAFSAFIHCYMFSRLDERLHIRLGHGPDGRLQCVGPTTWGSEEDANDGRVAFIYHLPHHAQSLMVSLSRLRPRRRLFGKWSRS